MHSENFLSRHKFITLLLAFACLTLIAYVDYITSVRFSFAFFYLTPIAVVAWYIGLGEGILTCIISVAVWLAMDYFMGQATSVSAAVAYKNAFIRSVFLITITILLSNLKKMLNTAHSDSKLKSEILGIVIRDFNDSLNFQNTCTELLKKRDDDKNLRLKVYDLADHYQVALKQAIATLAGGKIKFGRDFLKQYDEVSKLVRENSESLQSLSDPKNITPPNND